MNHSFVLFFVSIGGAIGAVLRYQVFVSLPIINFPLATFVVNIVGSFFMGFLFPFLQENMLSPNLRFFLTVGLLGALTTFSTYAMDLLQLLLQKQYKLALLYFFLSNSITVLLAAFGFGLSQKIILTTRL